MVHWPVPEPIGAPRGMGYAGIGQLGVSSGGHGEEASVPSVSHEMSSLQKRGVLPEDRVSFAMYTNILMTGVGSFPCFRCGSKLNSLPKIFNHQDINQDQSFCPSNIKD